VPPSQVGTLIRICVLLNIMSCMLMIMLPDLIHLFRFCIRKVAKLFDLKINKTTCMIERFKSVAAYGQPQILAFDCFTAHAPVSVSISPSSSGGQRLLSQVHEQRLTAGVSSCHCQGEAGRELDLNLWQQAKRRCLIGHVHWLCSSAKCAASSCFKLL
jgi:hypothetical protein